MNLPMGPKCLAVLVVEDDREIRDRVITFLRDHRYDVYSARNSGEALELLRHTPHPTLILTDWMTPAVDGVAFIPSIHGNDKIAALPVVIVTSADGNAKCGYRLFKKPSDMESLLHVVSELCDPSN